MGEISRILQITIVAVLTAVGAATRSTVNNCAHHYKWINGLVSVLGVEYG
ncbi:Hypothetical predicted protein [Olea europaea subsp. europaea]|uniref:Uncharacterized protein n=1 Tax=Olea europaea subsp. europaea TaxID=158383 RepID=A0A8S0PZ52_OLEEU|nr:Hypothetical predicted protein [Olea europaea subsp. europaea]